MKNHKKAEKKINSFSFSIVIMIMIASVSLSMVVPIVFDTIDDSNKRDEVYAEYLEKLADYEEVSKYKETMPNFYNFLDMDNLYEQSIKLKQKQYNNLTTRIKANMVWIGVSAIIAIALAIKIIYKIKNAKKHGITRLKNNIKIKIVTAICFVIFFFSNYFVATTLLYEAFDALIGKATIDVAYYTGPSLIGIVFLVITIVLSILLTVLLTKSYEYIPAIIGTENKKSQMLDVKTDGNINNLENIAKLKELLDSNAITQDEFDKMKKELLYYNRG